MKTIALFITVVGLAMSSPGTVFADEAAKPSQAKKPGEQISPAVIKTVRPHNAPILSPSKSGLPVNAGPHGPATIGGAIFGNATKSGTINGTEIKRRP